MNLIGFDFIKRILKYLKEYVRILRKIDKNI